jgi:hypothetical protein
MKLTVKNTLILASVITLIIFVVFIVLKINPHEKKNTISEIKTKHIALQNVVLHKNNETYANHTPVKTKEQKPDVINVNVSLANDAFSFKRIETFEDQLDQFIFKEVNEYNEWANWTPLRQMDMENDDLEIRFWMSLGGGMDLQGLRLCRKNNEWTGFYLLNLNTPIHELKPKTNWAGFWEKVEAFGILVLPDTFKWPNNQFSNGGIIYVVEVNDETHYRTYMYGDPQNQDWPEAKKLLEIIKTFHDEFKDSLPPDMPQWYRERREDTP